MSFIESGEPESDWQMNEIRGKMAKVRALLREIFGKRWLAPTYDPAG
jgi:hypothetical protein